MHTIAAKAVCFGEALSDEFKAYQQQIARNAKALSERLLANGVNLVSGGTDNHLMLVDLRGRETTGKDLENRLDSIGITVNKNAVPNDPRKPSLTSGIRVGTPAATTRGLVEEDFVVVADIITAAIGDDFEEKKEELRAKVAAICAKYPLYN
jgi:glycine hydroxymethyltransferase